MSSIGVIGGADGPTKVFVSGPVWPWLIFAAAAVALVVFLIVRKKRYTMAPSDRKGPFL